MTKGRNLARQTLAAAVLTAVVALAGCDDDNKGAATDGGLGGATGKGGSSGAGGAVPGTGGTGPSGAGGAGGSAAIDAGAEGGGTPDGGAGETGPGATLEDPSKYDPGFTATAPNRPRSIQVTFSGETLGSEGLPFPPTADGEPAFADGWSVEFQAIIGVVGNIRLSPGALKYPNQKQIDAPIATKRGPYVLEFSKPGALKATDGESPAGGVFLWDKDDAGNALDTGMRYAFSYDLVPAAYPAINVNLPVATFADYDVMVKNKWTKFVRGTATYKGAGKHPDAEAQKRFDALPKVVHFSFGWNDAGGLVNCINPDLAQAGSDEPGENLANRGLQPTQSGAIYAQITWHIDHMFWDALKKEGTPLRFDHIAAWAPANTTAEAPFNINTLKKPLVATFSDGFKLPDRGEVQGLKDYKTNQIDMTQVVFDRNGVPATHVPDIANFMAFSAQSAMHMNADGLCYVVGQEAADPFYKPGL